MHRRKSQIKPTKVTKKRGRKPKGIAEAFATVCSVESKRYGVGTIRNTKTGETFSLKTGERVQPKLWKVAFADAQTDLKNRRIIMDRESDGVAEDGSAAKQAYFRAKKKLKGTALDPDKNLVTKKRARHRI